MCPPSLSSSRIGRSRFTGEPAARAPRPDLLRVSLITSALNVPPAKSVTVRQTPLMAMESPLTASAVTSGPRTVSRAASLNSSMATISPSSSTIPVNTAHTSFPRSQPACHGLRGSRCRADCAWMRKHSLLGRARASSHPDCYRRPRNSTGSAGRWPRPGRGLSPPVRSFTDPGARLSAEPVCHARYSARDFGGPGLSSADRGAAPAGHGVQSDGGEQHDGGPDVLRSRAEPEQGDTVVDDRDDEPAEHRAQHPAPATEQADAANPGSGDGVQHVLAALEAG